MLRNFQNIAIGPYIVMRMRTVTILKFDGASAVQMDFLFENCTL